MTTLRAAVFRQPLQFAVGALLAVGLVVSALVASAGATGGGSRISTDFGYGYGYAGHGLAKGHREHCPSETGRIHSKGHAVCFIAPRHGR